VADDIAGPVGPNPLETVLTHGAGKQLGHPILVARKARRAYQLLSQTRQSVEIHSGKRCHDPALESPSVCAVPEDELRNGAKNDTKIHPE